MDEDVPSVTDAYNMVNVAEGELQQLVGQDASRICKSKQAMIRKNSSQSHCPCMYDCLVTKVAQASMSMHNLDLFSNDNVPEDGEERKDCRKGSLEVYDEKGYMIHL
jgi:hypothetical protein